MFLETQVITPGVCVLSTCAACLSVAAVNQAVKENKVTQTLRVLSLPELQLQGLISNCAADYQKELGALITHRTHTGNSDPECHSDSGKC